MDEYFRTGSHCKVVLLVDIRHEPTRRMFRCDYMKHYELDGLVAATRRKAFTQSDQ